MLISQSDGEMDGGQGCSRKKFAELRRLMASPSQFDEGLRQHIEVLATRLARVRALGGEYNRVGLSEAASGILHNEPVAV